MLHKDKDQEKARKYLSRRALLKGLGMGAGIVALGGLSGCTQFLSRSHEKALLAPAKARGTTEREFTRRAYEVKEAWKEVLRDYYRWQATSDERIRLRLGAKVQQAKQKALDLLDNPEFATIAQKFDQGITTVKITPLDKERFIQRMRSEWWQVGIPKEEVEAWEEGVREADLEIGRKAILTAGGFAAYVRALVTGFSLELELKAQASAVMQDERFQMKPLIACIVSGLMCVVGVIALIVMHETDQGDQEDRALLAGATAAMCGAAVGTCQKRKKKDNTPQPPPQPPQKP